MTICAALEQGFTSPVRDVLWGHVYFSPALEDLTRSAPFMRLHRIMQLGPTHYVYPGATHTRAAHSIGVYHLARRLLVMLVQQDRTPDLTTMGCRSFLAAALLHDLGHFPYAHSLKTLPLTAHESLTAGLVTDEPLRSLLGRAGADPDLTAAIVDNSRATGSRAGPKDTSELAVYRTLLSGCLDPDKLDYLNRDARYCGVPYGVQDVDFVLSRLRIGEDGVLGIDSKGIPCVESVLFAKYLMYRTVYWHPAVRAATAMIKKALTLALEQGRCTGEALYALDDQGLFALLATMPEPMASLGAAVQEGRFFVAAGEAGEGTDLVAAGKGRALPAEYEAVLAERLGVPSQELILDVPEPISFETGLLAGKSVFTGETVAAFHRALGQVRVFTSPAWVAPAAAALRRQGGLDALLAAR